MEKSKELNNKEFTDKVNLLSKEFFSFGKNDFSFVS